MSELIEFGIYLYAYCTDFIINLANIFSLSYYEINFVIFCLVYPLLFVGLLLLYFVQNRRLKSLNGSITKADT